MVGLVFVIFIVLVVEVDIMVSNDAVSMCRSGKPKQQTPHHLAFCLSPGFRLFPRGLNNVLLAV